MSKLSYSLFMILVFVAVFQTTAFGMVVADTECPYLPGPAVGNSRCTTVTTCERTDCAPVVTNAGTPGVVLGGMINCDNCAGCPDNPPSPMVCLEHLEACFTESLNVSVNSAITTGIPGIEAEIGSTIGAEDGREVCHGVTCGTENFPPCKMGSYTATQTATNGITATMTHKYVWRKEWIGGPWPCPIGQVSKEDAGTRKLIDIFRKELKQQLTNSEGKA